VAVADRQLQPAKARRPPRESFSTLTTAVALLAPTLVLAIVVLLAVEAFPAIQRFGADFLVTRAWNPVKQQFGALPFIYGTLVTACLALAMVLPVGVGTAVFLAEPSLARIRMAIGVGVELLAAIPSVVYGIWGLYVFAPWLLLHVSRPLSGRFGSVPVLSGPARQTSILAASIVLAVMILPTLASISREVIRAVPSGMKEASFALGATWWETTWKVILPAARPGIFGATVLAFGRALGETIAVTMIIGNRPEIQASLFGPAYTLASVIANEFTEATGSLYPAALIELGLILMLVALVVNLLALLLVRRVAGEHATRATR
jgi:phosphate transport system permease protein